MKHQRSLKHLLRYMPAPWPKRARNFCDHETSRLLSPLSSPPPRSFTTYPPGHCTAPLPRGRSPAPTVRLQNAPITQNWQDNFSRHYTAAAAARRNSRIANGLPERAGLGGAKGCACSRGQLCGAVQGKRVARCQRVGGLGGQKI